LTWKKPKKRRLGRRKKPKTEFKLYKGEKKKRREKRTSFKAKERQYKTQ
jgi:hypothetical protein